MKILAVLLLCIVLSELLVRRTFLAHLGSALVVIVLTAIAANAGLIPTVSPDHPVPLYDAVFAHVAPLAIFWLLLRVDLRATLKAGGAMIALFLIGSAGTVAGVLVGMAVVDRGGVFGAQQNALGGMFVGTYTGGSVNFNAVALHYGVVEDGPLYAGAAAVDSLMTTIWMAATLLVPRLLLRWLPGSARRAVARADGPLTGVEDDTETLHPVDLAVLGALGAGAVWLSDRLSAWTAWPTVDGTSSIPPILILTALALALAQVPAVGRLRGTRLVGMFAVYLFLAVIGALCDVGALMRDDMVALAPALLAFAAIVVAVHGLITFGLGALLRLDPEMAAVASQANVGGGTTALALARSLGRADLVLPGILVGSLGTALGTFLGFWTAGYLA